MDGPWPPSHRVIPFRCGLWFAGHGPRSSALVCCTHRQPHFSMCSVSAECVKALQLCVILAGMVRIQSCTAHLVALGISRSASSGVTVRGCFFARMPEPDPQERCTEPSSSSALMGKDHIKDRVDTPSFCLKRPTLSFPFDCSKESAISSRLHQAMYVLPVAREWCCVVVIWDVICIKP